MKNLKIAFTGGGSGGHLMPIIAIVRELRRLHQKDNLSLHYIGPSDAMARTLLAPEGMIIHPTAGGKIRKYFSLENSIDIAFKIPAGFLQSLFILLFTRPKLLFCKGGTGSAATGFAARVLGIPVFVHESDAEPGSSNKLVSAFAKKIFISFPKTEFFSPSKTTLTGNPIKKELLEGTVADARELFSLTLQKPVLLFMGGSQGAEAINDFVLNGLSGMLGRYEVIHVTGRKHFERVSKEAEAVLDKNMAAYYHPKYELSEVEMRHAMAAASIIISRAGSGHIFEIAACGKPSILVPLPGHQSKNAYQYAATGAAMVIEQENLSPNFFTGKINYLLENPGKVEGMQQAALAFAKPLAAKTIAREILEYLEDEKK